jgi:protein-S-isoprenylcysteine O-methyltransferase Ste14
MVELGTGQQYAASIADRLKALQQTKLYDLLATSPLIGWYALCLRARFPDLVQQIAAADLATIDLLTVSSIVSKFASLAFISVLIALLAFRATPRAKAPGLIPRVAALAGTYLGVGIVLLPPIALSTQLYLTSTLLIVGGTVFALYSALKLGRSISMMSEARRLVTRGPYAVIRHPLYLGEGIALVGLTLQFLSPWAVLILAFQCTCQVERMKNEERILLQVFPEYRNYMAHTGRLVPYIY